MSPGNQILLIIVGAVVTIIIASYVILDSEYEINNETGLVEPTNENISEKVTHDENISRKATHDNYESMKQKYGEFLLDYNALVASQRNVIPYPINYSYVTGEGFTDEEKGIEWCSTLSEHAELVESLLAKLNNSMDEFDLIENKTSRVIELIDTKYDVLSDIISEEIKGLEYKYYRVNCSFVLNTD